jgi:hypothetical protein
LSSALEQLARRVAEVLRDVDLLGGRRGLVVVAPAVPAVPGVRSRTPLSPKKSEKNSSKRLRLPKGARAAPRF